MIEASATPKISLQTYLDEVISITYKDTKKSIPRLKRISELVAMNGYNFKVESWGAITDCGLDVNPYGRLGLYREEALELLQYEAFILGYLHCDNPVDMATWLRDFYENELMPVIKEENMKQRAALDAMIHEHGNNPIPDDEHQD